MIKGFEEQTKDLTPKEKQQARNVWFLLQKALRNGQTISNRQLREIYAVDYGGQLSGARVRKMINWMHRKGHLPGLIASSNGYSQASERKELVDYAESLEARIASIQMRLDAVQVDLNLWPVGKESREPTLFEES